MLSYSSRSQEGAGSARMCRGSSVSVYGPGGASSFRLSGGGGGGGGGASSFSSYGSGGGGGFSFGIGSFGGGAGGMDISTNDELTLQNLNQRLGSYLDQVRQLENANAELELKIQHFLDQKASPSTTDYSVYFHTIADLKAQIQDATRVIGGTYLSVDNAKLAADDFRLKFENELLLRQSVEADMAGLKRLLDELTLGRSDLELQVEDMREELIILKKNHDQELLVTQSQMSGQINVEVDCGPQKDLSTMMDQMREYYENLANKNRKELQSWFENQTETLKQEVAANTESIQTSSSEVKDLKRSLQELEIELQSQLSMKASLEGTLADIQNRYAMQLVGFQNQVTCLEEQLVQMRASMAHQAQEYQVLLDIKTRLEMEIQQYRKLLEGAGSSISTSSSFSLLASSRSGFGSGSGSGSVTGSGSGSGSDSGVGSDTVTGSGSGSGSGSGVGSDSVTGSGVGPDSVTGSGSGSGSDSGVGSDTVTGSGSGSGSGSGVGSDSVTGSGVGPNSVTDSGSGSGSGSGVGSDYVTGSGVGSDSVTGSGVGSGSFKSSGTGSIFTTKQKVITVIEELVDGQVVSTRETVSEINLPAGGAVVINDQ